MTAEVDADPDFLLEVAHLETWQAEHGALPDGGWLLYRTGWDSRAADQDSFLNADETGPHTPGISVECARWLAESAPIIGIGVETVGTDAGAARHPFAAQQRVDQRRLAHARRADQGARPAGAELRGERVDGMDVLAVPRRSSEGMCHNVAIFSLPPGDLVVQSRTRLDELGRGKMLGDALPSGHSQPSSLGRFVE